MTILHPLMALPIADHLLAVQPPACFLRAMPMSRFHRVVLVVAASLLTFAAGCSEKNPTASTASSPSSSAPKILRAGNGTEPQDLDPHVVTGVPQDWAISDDGLVYTVHLRDSAKWSNGEPLTSEDFVHSFQRIGQLVQWPRQTDVQFSTRRANTILPADDGNTLIISTVTWCPI
jgi:ABC-type oligopeptide transport system substrate-binding subunit